MIWDSFTNIFYMRETNEKRKLTFQDILAICEREGIKYGEESMIEHPFPWDEVEACMNNEVEPAIEGLPCPKCGKELRWIRFRSSAWTWHHLCGREGPLAICTDCHEQVYFDCEVMN